MVIPTIMLFRFLCVYEDNLKSKQINVNNINRQHGYKTPTSSVCGAMWYNYSSI